MKRSPLKRKSPLRKRGESTEQAAWRQVREAVLERDHYTCQHPGHPIEGEVWGALHVHHRLRRSQGGGDSLANCVTLCRRCHDHVHAHPAESYRLGFLHRRSAA